MDDEACHPRHPARTIQIDGVQHSIFREKVAAAELYDLADKSPDEWQVVAELQGGDAASLSLDDELDLHEGRTAVFHMSKRPAHHHDHGCELTVVVASDPVRLDVTLSSLLGAIISEALVKANAAGRERDEWELKTEAGVVLDPAATMQQAGVECGATLFLSLKAGAAGEAATQLLADPAVSRAKFEDEVSRFRSLHAENARRGIWLVRAEFPTAVLLFGTPKVGPLRFLAFGAVLDFSNYDLWPPSVRIVDPVGEVPYKGAELPPHAHLLHRTGKQVSGPGGPAEEIGRYMTWQDADEVPFLCHAGIREYHEHPAHTGDSWLLHRGTGEGTLARIVDLLFTHGSSMLVGLNIAPAIAMPST